MQQTKPDKDGFLVKPGRQRRMKRKWKEPGKKAQNGGPRKRKQDIPPQGTK